MSGQPTPLMVPTAMLSGVVCPPPADEHSLTLKSDGAVWAFGNDTYGEMGTPPPSTSNNTIRCRSCNQPG